MKQFFVQPSGIGGTLAVPPSKSHTLRAILFGSLAAGRSVISNPLPSPDADAMVQAFRLLGADIKASQGKLILEGLSGRLGAAEDVIDAGNSGIVFRFVSAVAALSSYPIVITGDASLRHRRPIGPLLEGLKQLGAKAVSTKGDGHAPVIIEGPLRGGKSVISGEDSQPVSALLIAAALSDKGAQIHVDHPGEIPWIDLTLDWFRRLGLECEHASYQKYRVRGRQQVEGFAYQVPGDFSTAAFPIVAALITGSEVTLHNLDFSDPQGDKQVIEVFQRMGAPIAIDRKTNTLHVGRVGTLKGIELDLNDMIDAITPLAVLACFADGPTVIKNARIARFKECDRISATARELKKMGAAIEEKEDGLIVHPSSLRGSRELQSHCDHRMAMSLAVAAMAAQGESCISGVACVKKTYPQFDQDFRVLGARIEVAE